MPINGITSDIASEGITISGTPFGGTRPGMGGGLVNPLDGIALIARTFKVPIGINAGGSVPLPVAFGKNKYVLAVAGKTFCPGVDFVPGVNAARWVNENEGVSANEDITVWGAGNDYTADAVTIERVDMRSSAFTGTAVTLVGSGDSFSLPANTASIYMVVNQVTVTSFTWDGMQIQWTGSTPLTSSDQVFFYYFNKLTTTPYSLGDNQTRVQINPSSGVSLYNIGAIPKASVQNAAQLMLNGLRKVYGKDYFLNYPSLRWAGTAFTGGESLDLSFIRESLSTALIVNNVAASGGVSVSIDGKFEAPTTGVGSTSFLNLLTINGTLMVGPSYSHITVPPGKVFVPEYSVQPTSVKVDPEARGLPPLTLTPSDEYVFTTFRDVSSSKFVKIEYFKGWAGPGDTKTLQDAPADISKVIVWIYGRAYFSFLGNVNVVDNTFNIVDSSFPADVDADIVVLYITDAAYSALWDFEQISFPEASWSIGSTIGDFSGRPIGDISNTFLFVNGQREVPGKYGKTFSGRSLLNVSLESTVYGSGFGSPDQVVLVKI